MFTIPPLTSDILAVNSDAPASPTININLSGQYGGSHSFGWGLGWYPGKQHSAMVVKDPVARNARVLTSVIADWSSFRSNIFLCKIRGADSDYSQAETQPFSRSFAGRDWLFMHNGDLDKDALDQLHGKQKHLLEPLGKTDSELAFCDLLAQLLECGARTLAECAPEMLQRWFRRFDELGSADMYLSDGQSIAFFQGSHSPKQLSYARIQPPHEETVFVSAAATLTLDDPRDAFRTSFVVTSSPFPGEGWTAMSPGQLIIANHGSLVWNSAPSAPPRSTRETSESASPPPQTVGPHSSVQAEQAQLLTTAPEEEEAEADEKTKPKKPITENLPTHTLVQTSKPALMIADGKSVSYRVYDILHTTHYSYSKPVEHSTHLFRLRPDVDTVQEVLESRFTLSSPSEEVLFEDVFGNQSIHCTINEPYKELSVAARSRVRIFDAPADDHGLSRRQTTIPLIWMPWQRQMMMPYLLPEELPESQLRELTEYAMSFVERNDHHLIRTIKDINVTIYKDFKYVPGSTSINTTPFEVYMSREGVCQDFANLFICLARLLSIPARYRMGYIYTGASYENKIQSDASHAWAEVYLPYIGWRGFDPTNGCAVGQDHARVACGRNYVDATPTKGTIYKGGGTETLSVEVKMTQIDEGQS